MISKQLDEFLTGQHGPDFDGDKLLIYDNGREQSRVSILTVDRAARVATLNWSWEGEGWHEKILGDADWLPENHVLVHRAHSECIYDTGVATETWEVDRATGEVVWSLALDDIWASSYRAERVESCLLWQDARYCEKTRSRLDELAPEFGW